MSSNLSKRTPRHRHRLITQHPRRRLRIQSSFNIRGRANSTQQTLRCTNILRTRIRVRSTCRSSSRKMQANSPKIWSCIRMLAKDLILRRSSFSKKVIKMFWIISIWTMAATSNSNSITKLYSCITTNKISVTSVKNNLRTRTMRSEALHSPLWWIIRLPQRSRTYPSITMKIKRSGSTTRTEGYQMTQTLSQEAVVDKVWSQVEPLSENQLSNRRANCISSRGLVEIIVKRVPQKITAKWILFTRPKARWIILEQPKSSIILRLSPPKRHLHRDWLSISKMWEYQLTKPNPQLTIARESQPRNKEGTKFSRWLIRIMSLGACTRDLTSSRVCHNYIQTPVVGPVSRLYQSRALPMYVSHNPMDQVDPSIA